MNNPVSRLSATARLAVRAGNWAAVKACARDILKTDRKSAEGWFLSGLAAKASGHGKVATQAFSRAIHNDPGRYDAAIELAWQHWISLRMSDAAELLGKYEFMLDNSPLYLELAANIWSRLGLHDKAYPLYLKATQLQPEINRFRENLAKCAVYVGKIDQAKTIYQELLEQHPHHQRNHYALSRLGRARDSAHLEQMKKVLDATGLPSERNIFLYYAMAKEYEDLEDWEQAFHYYKLAGDAAGSEARKAGYTVSTDVTLIDCIRDTFSAQWLARNCGRKDSARRDKTPIFIVGLPRTGTTLTERIIASHSLAESADETQFVQIAIQRMAGRAGGGEMTPAIIKAAAAVPAGRLADAYMTTVAYRLGNRPFFIDKLPENFLYLGFIAAAFPEARIVHLRRHPMDACFAMYKQSFFRFAYSLDDIAEYYLAYDRLQRHWNQVLADRMIEVEYERLVADPEQEIRRLLNRLGMEFEPGCLDFHLNQSPSATASAAQVREKAHTRSVGKWRNWEKSLQPLRERLEAGGIEIC